MQTAMLCLMRISTAESDNTSVTQAEHERAHLLATLELGFRRDGDCTRLIHRLHSGPLRVQKPLYPEGEATCHVVIVHPPGGVVGGDELRVQAELEKGSRALLSTPGAAKWYRANGHVSKQQLKLQLAPNAVLEWLPQETIFFNGADVVLDSEIALEGDAQYLGCEILCFGRTAHGERFTQGRLRQRLMIKRDDKPIWFEQGDLRADSRMMTSPLGLAGYTVCATLIVAGANAPAAGCLDEVRARCEPMAVEGQFGASQLKSVVVVRYLCNSSEVARELMLTAWSVLRPALLGQVANVPRIWNT
jgi:urease accessory protein